MNASAVAMIFSAYVMAYIISRPPSRCRICGRKYKDMIGGTGAENKCKK